MSVPLGICPGISLVTAVTTLARSADPCPQGEVVQCDLDSRYRVAIPRSGGGDPEAQTGLGLLYARGGVVGQDFARAQSLIRPAAEAGHPPALVQLDHRYAQQRAEEPKSGPPPLACYRAAAERGHVEAQSILACNYLNGPGVQ